MIHLSIYEVIEETRYTDVYPTLADVAADLADMGYPGAAKRVGADAARSGTFLGNGLEISWYEVTDAARSVESGTGHLLVFRKRSPWNGTPFDGPALGEDWRAGVPTVGDVIPVNGKGKTVVMVEHSGSRHTVFVR